MVKYQVQLEISMKISTLKLNYWNPDYRTDPQIVNVYCVKNVITQEFYECNTMVLTTFVLPTCSLG